MSSEGALKPVGTSMGQVEVWKPKYGNRSAEVKRKTCLSVSTDS